MSRTRSKSQRTPLPLTVVIALLIAVAAILLAVVTLAGGGAGWTFVADGVDPRVDARFGEATAAFSAGEFERAERLCREMLADADNDLTSSPVLLLAGKAAAQRGRFDDALAYWQRVQSAGGDPLDDDQRDAVAEAAFLSGRVLLYERHQAVAAEASFRRALALQPDAVPALHELARLLALEGRRTEAIPVILHLLALKHVDIDQLALLGIRLGTIDDPDLLKACYLEDRFEPVMLLGAAASTTFAAPPEQARILLEEAVRERPGLMDAQLRLGWLLTEAGDAAAFANWHAALPAEADEYAEIWALRGDHAQARNEAEVAMRCYWEAVRRDPNHRSAIYQLGQLLLGAGQASAAEPLFERNRELQELRQREDVLFHTEHTSLEPARAVAEQYEKMGRPYEAWGWSQVALQRDPDAAWAIAATRRLEPVLASRPPQTLPEFNPVRGLDLSDYPRPDWQSSSLAESPGNAPSEADGRIRLVDQAREAGLDFTYYSHSRPAAEGKRMYEFPGGGAAVLDWDLDGRPDLYFTQGCRWPLDPTQREHLDRLFRNVDRQRFVDATDAARLVEPGFSHGVTVGDFDNDGFPDLYVANIGRNRLFRNNGDGTFDDVTEQIEGDAGRWTTSCLLADLNGDGLPDLYEVNYVTADDVFERVCKHADGNPRMCMPFHFPGDQDQVYVNLGDGRFANVTDEVGIRADNGKGLGIVAADFDGSGRLGLLIANDTTPNFFFANQAARPGTSAPPQPSDPPAADAIAAPWFAEQAVATGLAFNGEGRAEGCMGIALGDVDQDGRFDLLITNFLRETNTLYRQQEGGVFVDATETFGLARPSVEYLGFGTQLFDPDLDGDLDLIVTNGHVDDVRAYGRPYQMRPQLFENPGSGEMIELDAATAGEFFAGAYLGRGLARGDWNGDGRDDVVISHLDGPAALLTSQPLTDHHYLAVRLSGTRSARDAIGAVVTARLGERTLVRQLAAGDGYQASNERRLVFGLGQAQAVDELEVRWPSGEKTVLRDLPADQQLRLVEGVAHGYSQP